MMVESIKAIKDIQQIFQAMTRPSSDGGYYPIASFQPAFMSQRFIG